MTTLRIGSAPLVKTTDQRRAERRDRLARLGTAVDAVGWSAFYALAALLVMIVLSGNYIPAP